MRKRVASWWDLGALESMYVEFVDGYRDVLDRWEGSHQIPAAKEAEAFADYVSVLTHWRRLPYLDPGLPVVNRPGVSGDFLA